ncbi:DUF188 domain-containing protein [Jeotgalibaca sp. MA1X17-3]|uniref:DUF188 domain-containing protein n=1 Tax=Jeotgalibaca sp. MA1X17-3 TaxID=2908211 RepID=UPI002882D8E5|nr:DUF188 domain-containing protein [Jeotgalibaca sp. MA1X17-3]
MPIVLVSSFAHYSTKEQPPHVEVIYVDSSAEAADYKIMQVARRGDILITQDYGLASLALGKGCTILHHKGFEYTTSNIEKLLHDRYLSAQIRKSGKRTKGPKPFTLQDSEKFRHLFVQILDQTT